jgi:phosphatidylserine decarboxylase
MYNAAPAGGLGGLFGLRLPITRYGAREIGVSALIALLVGAGLWFLWPPLIALPIIAFLYVLSFFRDPSRSPEEMPLPVGGILSPADGRVDFIGEADEPLLGGRCFKVSIFLSVLNVHLNRAPLSGTVEEIEYREGEFLDARRPESGQRNEANAIVFSCQQDEGEPYRVLVRQISGAIARRIVCDVSKGQALEVGQRIGMIKFGSRTDFCIPLEQAVDLRVKVGQKVAAGRSILGVLS